MHSIDAPDWLALLGDSESIPSAVKTRYEAYDLAVGWVADPENRLRGALRGLGIRQAIVQSPRLREPGTRHATERFRDTLDELDRTVPIVPAPLVPTAHDLATGLAWLRQAGLEADRVPVVAVHPGSGGLYKCWPVEQVAALIGELHRDEVAVVLIEGPADGALVAALARQLTPFHVPRLANASLATVLGVLAHCRAFLGNDSGLTHLAASLGMPTICLYGPTDPAVWAPAGAHVTVLQGSAACRCATDEEKRRCATRRCLAIPTADVRQAMQRAIFGPVSSLR
jgi:ADP-heptose:LPS heptosyltransferase